MRDPEGLSYYLVELFIEIVTATYDRDIFCKLSLVQAYN
jgi:hypothetical protein